MHDHFVLNYFISLLFPLLWAACHTVGASTCKQLMATVNGCGFVCIHVCFGLEMAIYMFYDFI